MLPSILPSVGEEDITGIDVETTEVQIRSLDVWDHPAVGDLADAVPVVQVHMLTLYVVLGVTSQEVAQLRATLIEPWSPNAFLRYFSLGELISERDPRFQWLGQVDIIVVTLKEELHLLETHMLVTLLELAFDEFTELCATSSLDHVC